MTPEELDELDKCIEEAERRRIEAARKAKQQEPIIELLRVSSNEKLRMGILLGAYVLGVIDLETLFKLEAAFNLMHANNRPVPATVPRGCGYFTIDAGAT